MSGPDMREEIIGSLGGVPGSTVDVSAQRTARANYGEIIMGFSAKYGIKVNSAQPDASSQDEINAAIQLKGQGGAPDVFDLGTAVALANTAMFAKYRVATWNDIPAALKEADGTWVNDYIVLVVGLAPVYAWVVYFIGGSALTLTFAYTILVLPMPTAPSTPVCRRSTYVPCRRRPGASARVGGR